MDYTELEKIVQKWYDKDNHKELGSDIHKETAAKMYNKPVAEVTDSERRVAKTRNFLSMYSR